MSKNCELFQSFETVKYKQTVYSRDEEKIYIKHIVKSIEYGFSDIRFTAFCYEVRDVEFLQRKYTGTVDIEYVTISQINCDSCKSELELLFGK